MSVNDVVPQVINADLGDDVVAFFTTRHGGVSRPPYRGTNLGRWVGDEAEKVLANREAVRLLAGLDEIVWQRGVHGREVLVVDSPQGRERRANGGELDLDALISRTPGIGVSALAADCVPVLLVARAAEAPRSHPGSQPDDLRAFSSTAVAAVHSGRVGTLSEVVGAAVEALRGLGYAEVQAAIGPSICGSCYEVPQVMQDAAEEVLPGIASLTRWGSPGLDLPGAIARQLDALGVRHHSLNHCTFEREDVFSHRREGVTGRIAGVIATRRGGVRLQEPQRG